MTSGYQYIPSTEPRIAIMLNKVPVNHEGIRVNVDREGVQGWLLLRMSLHDPILPLNIETRQPGGVAKVKEWLLPFFTRFESLDCSPLRS